MIQTEAIVLHAFDYRETSRIVRLATRELGVVSAIARGAKRPKSRFGQGLDLFTGGVAHLLVHESRDLHALTAFDTPRARPGLAGSLGRFGAAAALGELCIRFGAEAPAELHDELGSGLDLLAESDAPMAPSVALGTAWRIVTELGFGPSLEECALCHTPLAPDSDVGFAHRAGGAICPNCRPAVPGARILPAAARATMRTWLGGSSGAPLDVASVRAHQRLLREFLEEHLAEGKALRAWIAWERATR